MTGWNSDMDSAPRGGKPFTALNHDGTEHRAKFGDTCGRLMRFGSTVLGDRPEWIIWSIDYDFTPTHWKPEDEL